MPSRAHKKDKEVQTYLHWLIDHVDSLQAAILKLSLFIFFIAYVVQFFSLEFKRSFNLSAMFNEDQIKGLIPMAVGGLAGIISLTLIILVFVYLLREKNKDIKILELKVAKAFLRALDESPLKSHITDKQHREQLNP